MKRRLLAVLTAAFLLCLSVGPAVAVPITATRADPGLAPRPDTRGSCINQTSSSVTNDEATTSSPSQSRSGVRALLDVADNGFDICSGLIQNSGPSAWIGIMPKVSDGKPDSGENGMGFGIIECSDFPLPTDTFCEGEGHPHFFAWYGKCTQGFTVHVDLGTATYGTYDLKIYLNSDNIWHFTKNDHQVFSIPNSYVSCWSGGNRKAVWECERWNTGDSCGTQPNNTSFAQMWFGVFNQGWFNFNAAYAPACIWKENDDNCVTVDGSPADTLIIDTD